MKYIVVLGDGMADRAIEALQGKTPLEAAKHRLWTVWPGKVKSVWYRLCRRAVVPGSDTANLSVLGYNPQIYYSGRSPLEALNIGVQMQEGDVAVRANLVTLSERETDYEKRHILDHSADEISTEEAELLWRL